MIEIDVEGRPAPKGSRISKVSKSGHSYTYAASRFEKPWLDEVKRQTQTVMRHHEQPPPPYAIELEFRIHRPANHRYAWPPVPDLDKLARCVIDGLQQGGAILNDSHVTTLTVSKRYADRGEASGVHTRITSLAASEQLAA